MPSITQLDVDELPFCTQSHNKLYHHTQKSSEFTLHTELDSTYMVMRLPCLPSGVTGKRVHNFVGTT